MQGLKHPPLALLTSILFSWFFTTAGPYAFLVPAHLRFIAVIIFIIGVTLGALAFRELRKKKTTVIPTGIPTALATTGPYRLTRNPIYLGYLLIACSAAWYFGSLTAWIGPLYFFWIIDGYVIPLEEKNLREAIGFAYSEYVLNTRRWL